MLSSRFVTNTKMSGTISTTARQGSVARATGCMQVCNSKGVAMGAGRCLALG